MYENQRRFPRVPVRGTVRALLRRVSDPDTLPVTLREVSEGGLCVAFPGAAPDAGARVTVEMALWRKMLYLPANVVWSRSLGGTTQCGLKLHLEVTDAGTRRAFAGWVRNQASADKPASATPAASTPAKPIPIRETTRVRPRPTPPPEKPYELEMTEMDTAVTSPEPASDGEKSRGDELFDWLFGWKPTK